MKPEKSLKSNPGEPTYAANMVELSKIIGVSHQTIKTWAKRPGWPKAASDGRHNVRLVREWAMANSDVLTADLPDLAAKKLEIATEQARKLKLANDETEGRLVDKSKLASDAAPTLQQFKDLLYQKCGNEMPTAMAGVDVATGRMIGARYADELLKKIKEAFEKWTV